MQEFIFMSLSQKDYQRINFRQSKIDLKTTAKGLTRITAFKYRTMSKTNVSIRITTKNTNMVQQFIQLELRTWKEKNEKLFLDNVSVD